MPSNFANVGSYTPAMGLGDEVRWLTSDQQQAWRAYIMGTELLQHQLDRELREEHDISFSEYEILVRLSEAEGGRMRMAILADAMSHSRSRVTHTIARMERGRPRRPRGRRGPTAAASRR